MGQAYYSASKDGKQILLFSKLGFNFKTMPSWKINLKL
jgi:hypothetical protein